jgi:hypothetical protein
MKSFFHLRSWLRNESKLYEDFIVIFQPFFTKMNVCNERLTGPLKNLKLKKLCRFSRFRSRSWSRIWNDFSESEYDLTKKANFWPESDPQHWWKWPLILQSLDGGSETNWLPGSGSVILILSRIGLIRRYFRKNSTFCQNLMIYYLFDIMPQKMTRQEPDPAGSVINWPLGSGS